MAKIHDGSTQMIVGNLFSKPFSERRVHFLNDAPSSGEWRMTILLVRKYSGFFQEKPVSTLNHPNRCKALAYENMCTPKVKSNLEHSCV